MYSHASHYIQQWLEDATELGSLHTQLTDSAGRVAELTAQGLSQKTGTESGSPHSTAAPQEGSCRAGSTHSTATH